MLNYKIQRLNGLNIMTLEETATSLEYKPVLSYIFF